ncbi:MAG TPA: hypothetical protein VNI55_11935 [Gaiellaceae bacterium]|nr:hypothetical protein [Gaiellaceae bacterium]
MLLFLGAASDFGLSIGRWLIFAASIVGLFSLVFAATGVGLAASLLAASLFFLGASPADQSQYSSTVIVAETAAGLVMLAVLIAIVTNRFLSRW